MNGVAELLDRAGRVPHLQHLYAFALEPADHIVIVTDDDERRCIDDKDLPDRIQKIQEIHPQAVFSKLVSTLTRRYPCPSRASWISFRSLSSSLLSSETKAILSFWIGRKPYKYAADAKDDVEDQLFQFMLLPRRRRYR